MIAQREPMPDLSGYEQNREMQGGKKDVVDLRQDVFDNAITMPQNLL
jgi:hypothetical protein